MHLADAFIQSDLLIQVILFFFVNVCSLGIESTTFAVLTQCSTTELQEHNVCNVNSQWRPQQKLNWQIIILVANVTVLVAVWSPAQVQFLKICSYNCR